MRWATTYRPRQRSGKMLCRFGGSAYFRGETFSPQRGRKRIVGSEKYRLQWLSALFGRDCHRGLTALESRALHTRSSTSNCSSQAASRGGFPPRYRCTATAHGGTRTRFGGKNSTST